MNNVVNILKKCNVVGITFHVSPDGDSIGSALALALGLKKLNKKAYIICKDKIPNIFEFLPGSREIDGTHISITEDTECLVALDCGDIKRLNGDFNFDIKDYEVLNIDHHLSNDMYGDVNFVNTKACAVGEIVYDILRTMDIELDIEIATCLYTSIITDCGSFSFSNTTSATHIIAGELIKTGMDFNEIHRRVYNNKEFHKIKLLGKVINKMYLQLNNRLCVMELTKDMYNDFCNDISDTSDIISVGMDIDSIEVVAFFKEREDDVKVSLRAKNRIDVRKIAEYFGGGGHTKAAGFVLSGTIDNVKDTVIKHIEKELI